MFKFKATEILDSNTSVVFFPGDEEAIPERTEGEEAIPGVGLTTIKVGRTMIEAWAAETEDAQDRGAATGVGDTEDPGAGKIPGSRNRRERFRTRKISRASGLTMTARIWTT